MRRFTNRLDVHVSSHLIFLTGHSNSRLRIGGFISPVQIVLEQLRVHMVVLHPCSNPGSTLFRVRLSDHQATPAAQRRSKFRHHLLRDVNASAVLFVPGSRCNVGSAGTSGFIIVRYLAGAAGSGLTSTRPSCKL